MDDEQVWMTLLLAAWRRDGRMFRAIRFYSIFVGKSFDDTYVCINALKSGGHVFSKLPARAWLALYFKPVSDALWDGASDADAIVIWCRTPREKSRYFNMRRQETRKSGYASRDLQRISIGHDVYASGWRAKFDWKVVK